MKLVSPRTLMPSAPKDFQRELRLIGLALAAAEKSVQIVYERGLRPPEKLHEPWLRRVAGQLMDAFWELESEFDSLPLVQTSSSLRQGGLTVGVVWHFAQRMIPETVPEKRFPCLAAWSEALEALPEFTAVPHGDSTYHGKAGNR